MKTVKEIKKAKNWRRMTWKPCKQEQDQWNSILKEELEELWKAQGTLENSRKFYWPFSNIQKEKKICKIYNRERESWQNF